MEKVNIDKNMCIGCGACIEESKNCIEFDDDGKAVCIKEMDENIVKNIKQNCPVNAIK